MAAYIFTDWEHYTENGTAKTLDWDNLPTVPNFRLLMTALITALEERYSISGYDFSHHQDYDTIIKYKNGTDFLNISSNLITKFFNSVLRQAWDWFFNQYDTVNWYNTAVMPKYWNLADMETQIGETIIDMHYPYPFAVGILRDWVIQRRKIINEMVWSKIGVVESVLYAKEAKSTVSEADCRNALNAMSWAAYGTSTAPSFTNLFHYPNGYWRYFKLAVNLEPLTSSSLKAKRGGISKHITILDYPYANPDDAADENNYGIFMEDASEVAISDEFDLRIGNGGDSLSSVDTGWRTADSTFYAKCDTPNGFKFI